MTTPDITIDKIQTVELGPNDWLIITIPDDTEPETIDYLRHQLAMKLTDAIGERWMIVPNSVDLSAYRLTPTHQFTPPHTA
jgi:hypothetical protein